MKTLSDKIVNPKFADIEGILDIKDVKEFIKDLKEEVSKHQDDVEGFGIESHDVNLIIDKLAGDKLI